MFSSCTAIVPNTCHFRALGWRTLNLALVSFLGQTEKETCSASGKIKNKNGGHGEPYKYLVPPSQPTPFVSPMSTRYTVDKLIIRQHEYLDAASTSSSSSTESWHGSLTNLALRSGHTLTSLLGLFVISLVIYYTIYGMYSLVRRILRRSKHSITTTTTNYISKDVEAQTPPPELTYFTDSDQESLPCSPLFSGEPLTKRSNTPKTNNTLHFNDSSIKIHWTNNHICIIYCFLPNM